MTLQTILSLFPGVGLLDMAFEERREFSVVRGPDLIHGGDVRFAGCIKRLSLWLRTQSDGPQTTICDSRLQEATPENARKVRRAGDVNPLMATHSFSATGT